MERLCEWCGEPAHPLMRQRRCSEACIHAFAQWRLDVAQGKPTSGEPRALYAGSPEARTSPDLVKVRQSGRAATGRETVGARVYELAANTDLTWDEIAAEVGWANGADAMSSARRHARTRGLAWPLRSHLRGKRRRSALPREQGVRVVGRCVLVDGNVVGTFANDDELCALLEEHVVGRYT